MHLSASILWLISSVTEPVLCPEVSSQMDIPRIKTTTPRESWTCAGYRHGRDRADQLIYLRAAVLGQMAERFGASYIKYDVLFRLLQLPAMADRLYLQFSKELKDVFEAYSHGVEAGFQQALTLNHLSLAQLELAWRPQDSVGLLLLQSFYQTKRGFESQLRALKAESVIAELKSHQQFFDDLETPWRTSVLKDSDMPSPRSPTKAQAPVAPLQKMTIAGEDLLETLSSLPAMSHGSNSLVLSGRRTKSGYPILENDPHLEIQNPPFWYWIDLSNNQWRVLGAMVPGVPLFALGTNGRVSWGLTNSFFESTRLEVLEEPIAFSKHKRPLIWFKFGPLQLPFFFKRLSWTESGLPVWPQSLEIDGQKRDTALTWSGFKLDAPSFEGLAKIPSAKTAADFDRIAKQMKIPSWHYVFADQKSIGYRLVGRLPKIVADHPGQIVRHTPDSMNQILSTDKLAGAINPRRGFVATANNAPWPATYPIKSGWSHEPSFRAYRIEELIQSRERWALSETTIIPCDNEMIDSRFLIPLLRPFAHGRLASDRLVADLHCSECSLYGIWVGLIRKDTGISEATLYQLLRLNPPPPSLVSIIRRAFDETVEILGPIEDQHLSPWQKFHRISVRWLGLTDDRFQTMISTAGGQHSVNLGEARWLEDERRFQQSYGPSSRFLIEMSQPPKIILSMPGRNRRQRTESFAEDPLTKKWQHCEFDEYVWGR